jgi:hypothetical protein
MFFNRRLAVLAAALTILAASSHGIGLHAEITKGSAKGHAINAAAGTTRLATNMPIRVECWQEGRKIIDEKQMYSFSVNSLLEQVSVSFRREARGNPDVFIVSLKHATCLIQGTKRRPKT